MTESMLSTQPVHRKKIDIRERSVTMGGITGVNGYRVNRGLLKQRFTEGGYRMDETPHFLLFRRSTAPAIVIVHWFAPEEIDANVGDSFLQELKPLGVLTDAHRFGDIFGAIVCSLSPHDAQAALQMYGSNTLRRYRDFVQNTQSELLPPNSTMNAFGQVYRRLLQVYHGETFLDVGCSFGFLPLLMSGLAPSLTQIVGVDIETEPFSVVRAMAEEQKAMNVYYRQADVLADNFSQLGQFDTVVCIHVLEHFSEADMYCALENMLTITRQKLLLAVPYEEKTPEAVYGHEQLFTRAKLEAVGAWCLEKLGGAGRMRCEDCAGGLLIIERIAGR